MSTLFLIGNGFDVNCGMNTRYRDVYKGYVIEKTNSDTLRRFKETISSDLENWGDFEMAMAKYAKHLKNEDELLECVRDFAKYMEKHLLEEEKYLKKILTNKQIYDAVKEEVVRSISTFYIGISHNVDEIMVSRDAGRLIDTDVISFNYTGIFDMIFKKYLAEHGFYGNNVIHIHGVLGDDPVFGVDNIEQINVNYDFSRKGKRGFIKPVFNKEYDIQRVKQAETLIDNASTICVYGMSLGESDLSWRKKLIEWLRKSESNHLFIYQHSLSTIEYRTVSEKMDIEEAEKEKLLSEWEIDVVDSVFEQIHIPCGKNIFNVQKVIEKVEQEKYEKKKSEIRKKIEEGQVFVDNNLKNTIVV